MHPNLSDLYALELQLEREKTLLNLTVEQRLIRKAKLVTNSNSIKLPKINLYELLQAFGKRIFQRKKATNESVQPEPIRRASCVPLQGQVC